MTTQGGLQGIRTAKKVFLSHHKKHKRGKISTIGKITTQGGTLGPAEVGKKFGSNFWRTTYIFGADMRSLSQKTQNYIKFKPSKNWHRASEFKKIFGSKFSKRTRYSESLSDTHHKKHKISENCNNRKNDPPRGDPWTPKMLISQVLSFEPGQSYFLSIF